MTCLSRGLGRWRDNDENVRAVKGNIGVKPSFSVKNATVCCAAALIDLLGLFNV